MSIIQGNSVGGGSSGYNLTNSLRFRSSASARLTRTYTATGSAQKFTASMWVKRGILSSNQTLFGAQNTGAQTWDYFNFNSSDQLQLFMDPGTTPYNVITSSVFRDPSAWYHVVCAVDTTQATAANRVRIYVNGVEQPLGTNTIPQNYNLRFNVSGNTAGIATEVNYANTTGPVRTLDGYFAEINWIDGTQLTPSSFGGYSSYGQWQPAVYGGSYGTNGFYLPFTNNASTTTLGYDFSPNGNNWTTNNISLTAGSTYDSMTDVPALTSATAANYCVLNTLDGTNMSYITVSNANLTYSENSNSNGWRAIRGTIGVTSGKYRFSVYGSIGFSTRMTLGLCTSASDLGSYNASQIIGVQYNPYDGTFYLNGASTSYGGTQRITAVFDFIFDATTGKCWVALNGTLLGGNPDAGTGEMTTFSTTSAVFPVTQAYGSSWDVNFGQRPWDYTISTASSFVALNTYNL